MHDLWSTWVVARQVDAAWRFLSDGARWTRSWHEATLFPSLHSATRARDAAKAGEPRRAADVYQMAVAEPIEA